MFGFELDFSRILDFVICRAGSHIVLSSGILSHPGSIELTKVKCNTTKNIFSRTLGRGPFELLRGSVKDNL